MKKMERKLRNRGRRLGSGAFGEMAHRVQTVAAFAVAVLGISVASVSYGQFWDRFSNPKITVNIEHPPEMGLQVNRLVFGPATGECSDQIIQELIANFVSNGLEVIDRQNLDLILAEQNLSLSGYVDQATAASIGKLLGPSAMLVVRVQRCATERKRSYRDSERYDKKAERRYTVRTYEAKTIARVKASVQTVDLSDGRIFSARNLEFSPSLVVRSREGYPAYPSQYEALDRAYRSIVWAVHKMFLPRTEKTKLVYYDDGKCNLKAAYQALRSGLTNRAYELSLENLETCKVTPKVRKSTLAHAYYNVGMSRMIRGEYDKALEALSQAAELRPGDIVSKAIADTRKARDLAASMRQIEERAAFDIQQREAAEAASRQTAENDVLRNGDVIDMIRSGLPATIVMRKISTSKNAFDTSTSALVALSEAGVGEDIIMAIIEAE